MVDDASLKYKNREDHISEFITECIVIDPNGRITKTELNTEFNIWYQGTYGRGGPSTKEVHEYLDKHKRFSEYKTSVGAWTGARACIAQTHLSLQTSRSELTFHKT